MTAIILDTETADFKGPLIELAWLNIQTGETFQQRYNPARKIHPRATDVHHIRDEDVADQPHHLTVSIPRDVEYIIGHNISFDMRMLSVAVWMSVASKRFAHLSWHVKPFLSLRAISLGR
jgi:exodeoxyribonuclease X